MTLRLAYHGLYQCHAIFPIFVFSAAQFYAPSVLSSASSLPPSPQKPITTPNYRRLLTVEPPNDILTTPPSRPAVVKRPPLAVLSESCQGAVVKKQRVLYPSFGEVDELEGYVCGCGGRGLLK